MAFDAVIIGAGPSGLAAAARLAHFGVGVCLLEAHRRLGGYSTWHQVKGREVSTGLHAFTNFSSGGRSGPLAKLCRQLRLKYPDLALRPQTRSRIRFPSCSLYFTNDPEFLRGEVAEHFPASIDAFDRFRRRIRETDEGEFTTRQTSARKILEAHIKDALLGDMLFCPVMFYGNPGGVGDGRDEARDRPDMDWLLFCVVWKCVFESGFGHPARGLRPLWESLAARVSAGGGLVRMGARVKGFRLEQDRVAAAVLESGEEVAGRTFFSSAGAVETAELLGKSAEEAGKPAGSISIAEGISILDKPAAAAGMAETVIFYSFEDRFRFGRPPGRIESANGVVCAPGNYVPLESEGAAPENNHLLKITQLASFPAWRRLVSDQYAAAKSETAAGMTQTLGRLGIVPGKARGQPDAASVIDDLFTPLTLNRYTGHAEGALYGSPVKSRSGATFSPNLFLIGADQGFHGIVGAMLSGVAMANLHVLGKRE
ncbi:MAG: FAD-dependent oxidoreductase [Planctomycetes bacterium]|nr:FAD-dependent oxidoreductase [Planctomycetota bacterium]